MPGALDYTIRHPVGVVAAIVPWNAPIFLSIAKLAPALAAGCTVVLKPSELAPLSPIELVRCAERAGLPSGVLNLVTGPGEVVGAALVEHPGVDKVSFTGGTALGRIVGESAAKTFKRVSLELGGKSANIIFADADLDAATSGAVMGVLVNTGQQCIAGSRVLVQRPVYDEMVQRIAAAAGALPVGHPRAPGTVCGPLISGRHLDRVLGFVDEAGSAGRVVLGGERLGGDLADGYFLSATVVADVDHTSRLAREEVFGPVIAVLPFDTAAEAIAMANDTEFGLAGGVWTSNLDTAHGVAGKLRTGSVWVNNYLSLMPSTPFGGHKASGIGREGGWAAIEDYTELTNVLVALKPIS
jgi:aldehyde dehydrogenase (NAD+)